MSNRRGGSESIVSTACDDEINKLVLKLQDLLPQTNSMVSSKALKEVCKYIRKLEGEVDELSLRLTHLLHSMEDANAVDANILTALLH